MREARDESSRCNRTCDANGLGGSNRGEEKEHCSGENRRMNHDKIN